MLREPPQCPESEGRVREGILFEGSRDGEEWTSRLGAIARESFPESARTGKDVDYGYQAARHDKRYSDVA